MSSHHRRWSGSGGDDDDDNARREEQYMPYANADALSRNHWQAEGEEDDVDDGSDNKHINGVWGPHRADTGDGRWRRSWRNNDINDDEEEGGSHSTLLMTATRELEERLRSTSCNRQRAEEGEGNVDDGGDNEHVNGHVWGPRQADTGDG